jgi:SAM-dependent methyltransferase
MPKLPDDLVEDLVDAGSREHYADAALYDYEYRRRRADVTFYRELARQRGASDVLELGAGSGRVTIPLARDGHRVVALDQSPAMLARLRARIAHLPAAVADRITPAHGDLRSFAIPAAGKPARPGRRAPGAQVRRFPLVIAAFNVLEHLYTRGAFAFDVQLPDLAWLNRDPGRRWAKTRFTDPTTGRAMIYSTNHDYDPISQIALIRLYYEPAPTTDGRKSRRAVSPHGGSGVAPGGRVVKLSQRKFFPAELEALIAGAGFRVTARYGDFSFRPLDGTAESQVLVCEPAPRRGRSRAVSR